MTRAFAHAIYHEFVYSPSYLSGFKCNIIENAFIDPCWHPPIKFPRSLKGSEKSGSLELILRSTTGSSFRDNVNEIGHLGKIMTTCCEINQRGEYVHLQQGKTEVLIFKVQIMHLWGDSHYHIYFSFSYISWISKWKTVSLTWSIDSHRI